MLQLFRIYASEYGCALGWQVCPESQEFQHLSQSSSELITLLLLYYTQEWWIYEISEQAF